MLIYCQSDSINAENNPVLEHYLISIDPTKSPNEKLNFIYHDTEQSFIH